MPNFLSIFEPYLALIKLAIAAIVLAVVAWQVHKFIGYEQSIGYQRAVAEYAAKQAIVDEANAKVEATLRKQLKEARDEAIVREDNLQKILAASGLVSGGLRDALAGIRANVPTASIDSLRHSTDALATVLGECQSRYRDVAEKADRHASDVKTLIDSWPPQPEDR